MKTSTILAVAASFGGALATFKRAPKFDCPRNLDNKCEDRQRNGFDWSDLTPGDFSDYNGFKFKGFKCEDGPNKRNPHLSPRTGRKAITGRCGPRKEESPSFGCDQAKVDKFSITHLDLSVEFDTDLEFHYDMPGGKQCKHRARCSKGGSTVQNSQCGGAKNVTIVYPPPPNPPKKDCGISVHEIKFDCNPPEAPKPPKGPPKGPPPPPPPPKETADVPPPPVETPPPAGETTYPPVVDTPPTVENPPPAETTYPGRPPVQPPQPPKGQPPQPPKGQPPVQPPQPPKGKPPVSLPELPCPDVVPSCLNTWLFTLGCADNTDSACYCPDVAFVQNIFSCIYAYGADNTIISEAVVYFQGICAPHAPQNPAIVTGAETITKIITEIAKPTPIPSVAYTTVIVTATEVVPCTTDGSTIEGSSTTMVYEQTVEVPEVGFQTNTAGEVGVIATTAAPVAQAPPAPTYAAGPGSPPAPAPPATFSTVPTPDATPEVPGAVPTSPPATPIQVAGSNKVAIGAGFGLAIMAAVAAL